jgi:sugar phosphate isomerase/epimerase
MSDWPIGLSTGCFYQKSIFDCLEMILGGGFSLVEICSSRSHLDYHDQSMVREAARRMDRLGISAFSFHAPFADQIDITSTDHRLRNASVQEVIAAAEAAALLGARYMVIHPGPEHPEHPPGPDRISRLENCARSLNEIAGHCRRIGLVCALENKLPHLLFGNTADMLWLLGAMTETNIGVCLDTGHAYLAGELETAAAKLSRHLCMVHASDNRGAYDDHLPPGTGNIDWSQVIERLREGMFGGTIMLEIAGRGEIPQVLHEARMARHSLRRKAWKTIQ